MRIPGSYLASKYFPDTLFLINENCDIITSLGSLLKRKKLNEMMMKGGFIMEKKPEVKKPEVKPAAKPEVKPAQKPFWLQWASKKIVKSLRYQTQS